VPSYKIEINEYECAVCGYKWIRRKNGKDLGRPKKCSKCKRSDWDEGPMSKREKYLRNRLIQFEGGTTNIRLRGKHRNQPNELCKKFLWEIKPRPTEEELEKVNYPLDIDIHLHVGYIPKDWEGYAHSSIYAAHAADPESSAKRMVKYWWNSDYSFGDPDMDGWKKMVCPVLPLS
jgi:hypothetical protein